MNGHSKLRQGKVRQIGLSILVVATSWILQGCASPGQQTGYPYPPQQYPQQQLPQQWPQQQLPQQQLPWDQSQLPPYLPPTPGKGGPDIFPGQIQFPGQYQQPGQWPQTQMPFPNQGLPVQSPPWIINEPEKPFSPPPIVITRHHHHKHKHHKQPKHHKKPKHPRFPKNPPYLPPIVHVPQLPPNQHPFPGPIQLPLPGQQPPKGGQLPPYQFTGQLPNITKDFRPVPAEMVYNGFKGK